MTASGIPIAEQAQQVQLFGDGSLFTAPLPQLGMIAPHLLELLYAQFHHFGGFCGPQHFHRLIVQPGELVEVLLDQSS